MKPVKSILCFLLVLSLIFGSGISFNKATAKEITCDWPMFGCNPERTSEINESCGPLASSDNDFKQFKKLWSTPFNENLGFGSPIVADGKVFVSTVKYGDSKKGDAYCLDADTGKVIWEDDLVTGYGSNTTPVYDNGRVLYLTTPDIEKESSINDKCYAVCYKAATGKIDWKLKADSVFLLASPLSNGDTAYFNDTFGNYYSYSIKNGTKKWKQSYAPAACSMAKGGGSLYFVDMLGEIRGIDASTGRSSHTGKKVNKDLYGSSLTYHDGVLYVGSDKKNLYAYDIKDKDYKWEYKTDEKVWNKPSTDGKYVYVITGSLTDAADFSFFSNFSLLCINAETGELVWEDSSDYTMSSPSICGDYLYVTSGFEFCVYNKKTGDKLWSSSSIALYSTSPAIYDGKVYVTTTDSVECYGLPNISINPTSIDFGSIELGETITRKLEIKNDSKETQTYELSANKSWIKLSKDELKINTGKKMSVNVTLDYDRIPKDENILYGKITVKWDGNSKDISVDAYIKRPDDGSQGDFTECDGWNELNSDSYDSNSIDSPCAPISPVLDLEWEQKINTKDEIRNVYAFDNKIVLRGEDLYCHNLQTFKKRWNTTEEELAEDCSIVRHDGSIYFGTPEGISSVNQDTGRKTFEEIINDDLFNFTTIYTQPQPTVFDDTIYFTFENSLYAMPTSSKEAELIYTDEDAFVLETHPIVTDKYIIISNNGDTICLNKKTNKKEWSLNESDDYMYRGLAANEKYLFVNKAKKRTDEELENGKIENSTIACLDIKTKKEVWKTEFKSEIYSSFAVTEDALMFATHDGDVICTSLDKYVVKWKKHLSGTIQLDCIVTNGGLFVAASNEDDDFSTIYRLDIERMGDVTWKYDRLKGEPIGNIAIADGRVLVMTEGEGSQRIYNFKGAPIGDPAEIKIDEEKITIEIEDTLALDLSVKDENGYTIPNPELIFESSDEEICTVSEDGTIEAKAVGTCEITITIGTVKTTVSIEVVAEIDPEFETEVDFGLIDVDENPQIELVIQNKSIKPITVKLENECGWLSLDHDKFKMISKGSGMLVLSLESTELTLGAELQTKISVDWGYGTSEVLVKVKTKGPQASPNELELEELRLNEEFDFEDSILINNTASIWVDVTADTDAPWLTVKPEEFTLEKMKDEKLSVSINTEGLKLGKTYNGNVVLSWRKGGHIEIPITFVTPPDDVSPEIIDIEVGELVNASECEIRITTDEPCVVMVGEIEAIDPLAEPDEETVEEEDVDDESEDTDPDEVVEEPIDENDEIEPSDEITDPTIKDPVEDEDRSEYIYIATVPVEAAPSINEFEVIATDMSDNETRTSISVTNLYELVVTMQIGSNVMTVSGEDKSINPPPTVISGSTMVPVRAVSEAFGAEVEWVASTKSVIITLGDSTIILYVNSEDAMVNNESRKVSPAPQIVSGSTMLPFRFIAEALGAEVGWDGATKTITMTLKMEP